MPCFSEPFLPGVYGCGGIGVQPGVFWLSVPPFLRFPALLLPFPLPFPLPLPFFTAAPFPFADLGLECLGFPGFGSCRPPGALIAAGLTARAGGAFSTGVGCSIGLGVDCSGKGTGADPGTGFVGGVAARLRT